MARLQAGRTFHSAPPPGRFSVPASPQGAGTRRGSAGSSPTARTSQPERAAWSLNAAAAAMALPAVVTPDFIAKLNAGEVRRASCKPRIAVRC
jgi:hypothetical protein